MNSPTVFDLMADAARQANVQLILIGGFAVNAYGYARNTLDVSVVPAAQALTHLPVMVDPSHAVGRRDLVIPCALAGVAVGAAGLLVETHCHPEKALSDGPQALLPSEFLRLVEQARAVHRALQTPSLTGLWM